MSRKKKLKEQQDTTDLPSFHPVSRRIFPASIAHNLVSVQPMTGPTGAVFYWGSGVEHTSTVEYVTVVHSCGHIVRYNPLRQSDDRIDALLLVGDIPCPYCGDWRPRAHEIVDIIIPELEEARE